MFSLGGTFFGEIGIEGSRSGQFKKPTDIAIYNGRIYVVDEGNQRVQLLTVNGVYLTEWRIDP